MKRKTAWLVIIGFLSQLFLLGVNALGALPKNYGEPSGYWKMVESQEEIPEDEIFTTEFSDGYKRYGRSGTNLSFDWGAENRDYEPAVIVDGTVQGNYSKPPAMIKPYEPISFKVDLVVGHSSSVPVEFFDEVVAKIEFYASIDARDSVLEARVPITSNSSTSESMDVVFMPSNGLVNEMSIQIYLHGVSDLGGPMFIDYNYEWVEEEILLEKTIDLKGITLNAIGNPMPWMKLEIYVYYGTDVLDRDRDSDGFFTGVTDHQGRYQFTIPVPENSKGPVGIFIKAYLDSYYPFEQDRLLFRMVDHSDSQSVDQGFIAVGTWTVVKEESLKQVENDQTLKHYRLLAFYNLPLNALSMDAMTMPEPLFLFTGNQNQENQVGKLEDFSILYSAAHEAWFFGGALLDEKEALMDNPVTINFNSTETSHFDPSSNEIFIEVSCSKRDDYSKFVLLHEFGHYFDYTTNSIDNFRAGRGYKEEDVNHGGYMNKSTSDSYLEGFATAYAGLVEQYSGASVPGIIGGYILTDPPVYKAYGNNGEDEEFAIAALLFQTNQKYDDIQKFWNVISPDRLNFYEYYEAILEDLNSRSPASASWLRQFTIDSGLFKMPFGNGRYDIGEPFKDYNDNGEFDEGEVFADLMYDRDEEGYAMFGNPIEEFREEELIVGKVAPANTTETEPRYTTYQSQDSFLYLSGEIPDYVLVKFNLDQNRNYSALYSVNNKGHVLFQ